ncbi:Carboxymuconolactone decarboxylase [Methanohalobium evestigatum Z-7303]|jgi:alkylhydroperoxidase/carboxymuconolactone decarboxylase family protein YurZ|uniref:Carboxymuconolactone decarboxylase n=1 Tax=Methanohalobium evestigatum (strain ATCC BAA-1072 / DSM 3721 / NBRC 107634 / OCM 161 / Z-7303) TaxID=644295 RepID=D7E739_METEZ|nr:carboxymuconolactone decarboxylase family protein [Methanohalobium evestigatum]ADI73663.1 Carboxymuconolactone decarboxylase [Methanohalobium evestigatum Z-7303]
MENMELPEFLQILKEKDPKYAANLLENFSETQTDGALSAKTKLLIAMALDAGNGDIDGVKALSQHAREAGATEEEILEVIKVIGSVCGTQGLFYATKAFK